MLNGYFRKFLTIALLFMAGFFFAAVQVDAFTLKLESSGGTTVIVNDNGPGDSNPTTGAITYDAPIDNFIVTTTTGLSKPVVGDPNIAELDLSCVTTTGSTGGSLKITLSDIGFLLAPSTGNATLTSSIGGTTPGQTTYQSYVDRNNTLFGTGDITSGLQGPFTGAFGGPATTATKVFTQSGDFSITVVAVITTGANQTQSFGATTTVVPPEGVVGGCRMTGGHVKFYDDGTSGTVPGDAEIYTVKQVTVRRGGRLVTEDQVTWYTLGGQIGAPQAECLEAPDTAFGNWEHVHHHGSVSWNGSIFSGGFAFHSGTASAPEEAYIKCILCADPGWCVQARCAPFKQIFWEGTGVFDNIDAGTVFPNGCDVRTPGKNKPGTIHYYRAHVADFGEPAGSTQQQKPADQCDWTSAGVSISNGVLADGVTVLPWPPDSRFGDKGGQDCSVDPPSGECPDWYEIEIHCTADPTSPIIYKVGNFITHGNHQIHPEVGDQCPF
jgi:hypothetical protein